MAVSVSARLAGQLGPDNVAVFVRLFSWWKEEPEREFRSPFFGHDSAYIEPKVAGDRYVLRHVHLPPQRDSSEYQRWADIFRRHGKKTSDKVLVYVSDRKGSHHLIAILDEPGAHEIALMKSPEDVRIMQSFAAEAERFLDGGAENVA